MNPSPETAKLNKLVAAFLQTDMTLVQIAEHHQMTVLQLLEWSLDPKVQAVLKAVHTLARTRARVIAAESRLTALRRLDAIAATSGHQETARRAAMGILHASSPRRPRAARKRPEHGAAAGAPPASPLVPPTSPSLRAEVGALPLGGATPRAPMQSTPGTAVSSSPASSPPARAGHADVPLASRPAPAESEPSSAITGPPFPSLRPRTSEPARLSAIPAAP